MRGILKKNVDFVRELSSVMEKPLMNSQTLVDFIQEPILYPNEAIDVVDTFCTLFDGLKVSIANQSKFYPGLRFEMLSKN